MNKRAEVYNNDLLAGVLEKTNQGAYIFTYDQSYLDNPDTSAISLTLPKREKAYQSSI